MFGRTLLLRGSISPAQTSHRFVGAAYITKTWHHTSKSLNSHDRFVRRHIGPTATEVQDMLGVIGYQSLDSFIEAVVPKQIRLSSPLNIPEALSESEFLSYARSVASRNDIYRSHIGMGYYGTITPTVILRNVLESPAWYTPYTPYQAEIAQGRLESLLNYQTGVCELTGMEFANASLLDEGTAAAEAMNMCYGISRQSKSAFVVSNRCHPQSLSVLGTRANLLGLEVRVVRDEDLMSVDLSDVSGVLVQYPDTYGAVRSYEELAKRVHSAGSLVVVASDLLALCVLEPPGKWGADIVLGSSQRFGVPMGYGGPHSAFFATRNDLKRSMPGRIIGVSRDSAGEPALRMALQTREQHIRREKATSNVCTAQALLANTAAFYMIYHGPHGLKEIAERTHAYASLAAKHIGKLAGVTIPSAVFFDTVHVRFAKPIANDVITLAKSRHMNLRFVNSNEVTIAFDETTTASHVRDILDVFHDVTGVARLTGNLECEEASIPKNFARTSPPLSHPIFRMYSSETDILRYIYHLQGKDLGLQTAMIPLGSCTMKLNATSEMIPITWPEFGQLHPFAPRDQAKGYSILFKELSDYLGAVTGFPHISLQPNSGANGEYAGLQTIVRYHRSRGDSKRTVCLIPVSAHGTNPASAVMAGMEVDAVECDEHGNINVADLKLKAEKHGANLAAAMITYPSTHGVFEETIKEMCTIVHNNGGLVYMDGANMNAQVGLTRPADMGADVCHLNLHKTFCIPHGGGGPGMGPIGVTKALAPFLPAHSVVSNLDISTSCVAAPAYNTTAPEPQAVSAVSAAPWGSASILPISWAYIRMMGADGLAYSSKIAILNANYMAARLKNHFNVLYSGNNGLVAHEFILDLRPFKSVGVTEVDIAKRLLDHSFHAPTMSWPVHGTIMVEPTESESKSELDRFCDALIAIREEIAKIERREYSATDNPLKNAPHSLRKITSDKWEHSYSREAAAYPSASLRNAKFWPTVGRLDDTYGDRNLMCQCPPVSDYVDKDQ